MSARVDKAMKDRSQTVEHVVNDAIIRALAGTDRDGEETAAASEASDRATRPGN